MGHLLRLEKADLMREAMLLFAELLLCGVLQVEGCVLMDALAHNSFAQLDKSRWQAIVAPHWSARTSTGR